MLGAQTRRRLEPRSPHTMEVYTPNKRNRCPACLRMPTLISQPTSPDHAVVTLALVGSFTAVTMITVLYQRTDGTKRVGRRLLIRRLASLKELRDGAARRSPA